jgi:ATP phosphoribosyltransferase regulatory subunit
MRDLLPHEAAQQAQVSGLVSGAFSAYGYRPVVVPAFEYAPVIEKALQGSAHVLRFVEPETGEVVALRPDMTPQIARLVSSRLKGHPLPMRLCYRGSVLRRRHERARQGRQIQQVGFELLGAPELAGDLEVVELATASVKAAGLSHFTLDLSHSEIARSLTSEASPEHRRGILEALSIKDASELERRGREAGLSAANLRALSELPLLFGGPEIWERAVPLLEKTAAAPAVASLRALTQAIDQADLCDTWVVDLGEPCRFDYYTGMTFHILAEGPGEAVGSGGRYDKLLERFGADCPAAGFAVDLSNLCWALESAGRLPVPRPSLVVVHDTASLDVARAIATVLRARGISATLYDGDAPAAYQLAWGHTACVHVAPNAFEVRVEAGANQHPFSSAERAAEIIEQALRTESEVR